MLIKAGVDISRLERHTRRSLNMIEQAWKFHNEELVITSTYEGNHGAGSLHYANQAYDLRYPTNDHDFWEALIRRYLVINFDVVAERDHLHIEYDPH